MKENHQKTLLKGTGVFGIVEILRLTLRLFYNKLASLFLGTSGVGLLGFIENTIQLISSFSSFGISITGVREIAGSKNNLQEFKKKARIVHLFSVCSGVLAAVISLIFAKQLSILTFGNSNYFLWFVFLTIYFVGNGFIQSKTILLEGLQEVNKLLIINLLINFSNSVVAIFSFYYWGTTGILIATICNALISLTIYFFKTRGLIPKVVITNKELVSDFKKLIFSGTILAINVIIGLTCFFIIRFFLKNYESLSVLGIYNVGQTMLSSYLGMIFIAMGKIFFPKLAQTIDNKENYNDLLNSQLEICLLIILPVILFLYLFNESIIHILFSKSFSDASQILIFGLSAIIFKGFNYVTGYLILSQKNYKQYFFINALSDILNLIFTVLLYKIFGYYGIGLSLLLNYFIFSVYQYIYTNRAYSFIISSKNKILLLSALISVTFLIISYFWMSYLWFNILCIVLFFIFAGYSLKTIDLIIFNEALFNRLKRILRK